MSDAFEEETADGDDIRPKEGDEIKGDDDVEGYRASKLNQAENEGEEGGGENRVEGDILVMMDL